MTEAPLKQARMENLKSQRARWFVRGVLVGIALMLALHFVLTQ